MWVIIRCMVCLMHRLITDYLYNEHKVAVVSIADHSHFYLPVWREIVKKFGAVDGVQE